MPQLGLFVLVSAPPQRCTYAFLTTIQFEASTLVNISSFTLWELSFPLDVLTKLIVYCSQHVRTADFALDCKMFGKPHAFPAASPIPSTPASVAVVALTQDARSCPPQVRADEKSCLKKWWVSYLQHQIHRIMEFLLIARYTASLAKLAESFPPCLPPSLWISPSEEGAREDDLDVSAHHSLPQQCLLHPRDITGVSPWQQYYSGKIITGRRPKYSTQVLALLCPSKQQTGWLEWEMGKWSSPVLSTSPTRNGSSTWLITSLLSCHNHEWLLNVAAREMQIIINYCISYDRTYISP